jgi:hypothetical protein
MIGTREIPLIGNDVPVRVFCMLNLLQVGQGLRMSWRREVTVKEINLFLFGDLRECRVNGRATGKIVWPHESNAEILDHEGIIFNLSNKLVCH